MPHRAELLAPALRALRDHRDRNDPVRVTSSGHGVQRLSVGAAEGHGDDGPRCRDHAEALAVRTQYLDAGTL